MSGAGVVPAGSGRKEAVDGDVARQEPPRHALAVGDRGKIEAAAQAPACARFRPALCKTADFIASR